MRLRQRAEAPIPARLRVAAIAANRNRRHRALLGRVAAACLIFTAGAGTGWLVNTMSGPAQQAAVSAPDQVAQLAVAAHRLFVSDPAHPVEVGAERGDHLASWISTRLNHALPVPDLTAYGFRLIGGRILPGGEDAAAQIMYEDAQRQRLTIYIKTGEDGHEPPRIHQPWRRLDLRLARRWLRLCDCRQVRPRAARPGLGRRLRADGGGGGSRNPDRPLPRLRVLDAAQHQRRQRRRGGGHPRTPVAAMISACVNAPCAAASSGAAISGDSFPAATTAPSSVRRAAVSASAGTSSATSAMVRR